MSPTHRSKSLNAAAIVSSADVSCIAVDLFIALVFFGVFRCSSSGVSWLCDCLLLLHCTSS